MNKQIEETDLCKLFNRIIAWHEKNLPACLPYEPLPQIGFLIEELGEINRELINSDIDAAVGEITDLIVFSVNAIKLLEHNYQFSELIMQKIQLEHSNHFFMVFHRDILSEMYRTLANDITETLFVDYEAVIELCVSFISFLGYSPEIALEETVKKIESRRGAWNAETGKWEKEKNQPDVYQPDYSKAKIGE